MRTKTTRLSRRGYLTGVGTGVAAGVAGCVGLGGETELSIAFMPIFPDLQYFVMDHEGYLDDLEATIDAREFTDGPAIVQAYGGGEIDIAMFGIVPSMIVIDRGIPAKVTAANIKEPMAILAHEEFQALWDEHDADAFDVWEDRTGDPFRFGTFPQGSVPDVLLRYWLRDVVGVEPESVAEIVELGGANAVFQAIANGEVDGASIMEPVPTRIASEGLSIRTFRNASEIMPGQPAAVTLMSDEVRESPVATTFLRQHVRATEFIQANPAETADIVESSIGMPAASARAALDGPLANFVTNPREIERGTEIFAGVAHDNEQIDDPLSVDEIFDYRVYQDI
ncbi:MAG: ABC transporter substrate-binding protein [Natronomonas sp.]